MRNKRAHVLQLLSVVNIVTVLRDGEQRLKGVLLTWITGGADWVLLCSDAQDDPLVTWQLSEPMLLDAKDGAFETCYEHEMLQQRLVNNQARPPLQFHTPSWVRPCYERELLQKRSLDSLAGASCVTTYIYFQDN